MNSRRSHSITSSARASSDGGHFDAEQLGGSEINDQFGFGGLLDWQIGGLFTLEYPGRIHAN